MSASLLLDIPDSEREDFVASLDDEESLALLYDWPTWARPEQIAPPGDWDAWLILAGRGAGKTRAGAEDVVAETARAPIRFALVGANPRDLRNVMVEGESGVLACSPPWHRPEYNSSLGTLDWPNGSKAFSYSAETPSALRGPQHHRAWVDEPIKFKYLQDTWDQLQLGLRLGDDPRSVVTTTPKPFPLIKSLIADPRCVVTRGSTFDNAANLPEKYLRWIIGKYKGTALEAQEIYARILDEVAGALWTYATLEMSRVPLDRETLKPIVPPMRKVVVAIDPSVTSGMDSDETGIVAVGLGEDGVGYVLGDLSKEGGLDRHGLHIVQSYVDFSADLVVAEANNGGDLVEHALRVTRDADDKPIGRSLPFKKVHASRGKRTRAEPVAMLYQQGRVKHVGAFPELEAQMTSWVPGASSPDRMDALVWALTALMVDAAPRVSVGRVRAA